MTLSKQTQVIFLMNRLGIHPQVVSDYIVKFKNPTVEIRTYDDFEMSFFPKSWVKYSGREFEDENNWFFVFDCKDIKELENNILMLTKML